MQVYQKSKLAVVVAKEKEKLMLKMSRKKTVHIQEKKARTSN